MITSKCNLLRMLRNWQISCPLRLLSLNWLPPSSKPLFSGHRPIPRSLEGCSTSLPMIAMVFSLESKPRVHCRKLFGTKILVFSVPTIQALGTWNSSSNLKWRTLRYIYLTSSFLRKKLTQRNQILMKANLQRFYHNFRELETVCWDSSKF